MATTEHHDLSRRERQIMDVVYRLGRASATEVLAGVPDPPSYSAIRAHLRVLEDKGHLRHEVVGTKYVYAPTLSRARARRSAMRRLVDTFFEGSPRQAMAALLDVSREDLSAEDLDRLARLVDEARKEGL
jgi:predicted transcriptional regulator